MYRRETGDFSNREQGVRSFRRETHVDERRVGRRRVGRRLAQVPLPVNVAGLVDRRVQGQLVLVGVVLAGGRLLGRGRAAHAQDEFLDEALDGRGAEVALEGGDAARGLGGDQVDADDLAVRAGAIDGDLGPAAGGVALGGGGGSWSAGWR